MSESITLPVEFKYRPRPYQLPFLKRMASGCKRAVLIWHRRAGKDTTVWNNLIIKALQRVGTYYYFFPTFNQGRKILWDGMDKDGFRILDYIPKELEEARNETEMQITLKNGSVLQVIGTDKIDNIVGTNPIGCVFSEYSIQNPRGWEFVRPILTENGGWAVFVYTPRGRNHGYDLYREAQKLFQRDQSWFCQLLTVEDTKGENGQRIISDEMIQAERDAGMPEEMIQQEFYCSFEGSNVGSYWGKLIGDLRRAGRVRDVRWMPGLPVYTSWDLGYGDANAIWFAQTPNSTDVNVIDFEVGVGKALPDWAKIVKGKPYAYGMHFFPHDMKVHDWGGTGQTRYEVASDLGLNPFKVIKKYSPKEGIDAGRRLLPRCNFDITNCEEKRYPMGGAMRSGLDALVEYQKEWDEINKCFKDTPKHDWASNPADSFRYMSISLRDFQPSLQQYAESQFDVFTHNQERHSEEYDSRFEVFD